MRFTNEHMLVGTEWLLARLGDVDLRLVEVTAPGTGYILGHIAGAVYLDLDQLFGDPAHGPQDGGAMAAMLGGLGLDPAKQVVVYDEIGGTRAAQAFWLLEYLGFNRVGVLEGGIERWMAEGRPLSRVQPNLAPVAFAPAVREHSLATADWIAARLHAGDMCLLDCRTPEEYMEGHIPGAGNRPWDRTLVRRAYQAFRAAGELKADLAEAGATEDREVVVYCATGRRSAHTYLALRVLGYPRVRNYAGSWVEWSARPDLPKT